MNDEQQVWLAAYCAALTGALASGKATESMPHLSVALQKMAERAVDDFNKTWHAGEGRPPVRMKD